MPERKKKKKIQSSLYFSKVYPAASLWDKDFYSTVTFTAAHAVALFFSQNNSPLKSTPAIINADLDEVISVDT